MKKKTKKTKKSHAKKSVRHVKRRMVQQDMFPRIGESGERIKTTSPLMVRFTPEQYAFVRHAAALRGVNAAAFIRNATLDVLTSDLAKKSPAERKAWIHDANQVASMREKVQS